MDNIELLGESGTIPFQSAPLVTVICSTFNAGPMLREAVDSVLAQTYENIEIIVVDDGSTDGSLKAIEQISDGRIRIFRQPNRGKSVALNLAVAEARGFFYAIQDADDLSHPERIEKQLAMLLGDATLAGVFCGHDLIVDGKRWGPRFRSRNAAACKSDILALRMPAHDPTAMYRMEYVKSISYNPDLRIGQGYDYILRVGEQFPLAVLGECLYSYRFTWDSITRRIPARRVEAVAEVRRLASQRRGLKATAETPGRKRIHPSGRIADNNIAAHFMESVVDLRNAGRYFEALQNALFCARLRPLDPHYYKALLFALLPEELRKRVRPSERSTGRSRELMKP